MNYIKGILVHQTFDRNFDGKIDKWLNYKNGFEIDIDEDKSIDEVSYYKNGIIDKTEVFDKTSI